MILIMLSNISKYDDAGLKRERAQPISNFAKSIVLYLKVANGTYSVTNLEFPKPLSNEYVSKHIIDGDYAVAELHHQGRRIFLTMPVNTLTAWRFQEAMNYL